MSKNQSRKSESWNLFTVAAISVAICAAAVMLMPAQASSKLGSEAAMNVDVAGTIAMVQAAAGETGYFRADADSEAPRHIAPSVDADNEIAVIQAAAGDAGYLPSLYENQAKDVEPVRATY